MKAKTILIFLALVYTIGWLFQGLAVMNGFDTGGKNWLVVAMWAPLLAALLAGPQSRRQLWRGLKGGSFGWWLIALGTGWSFSICQQLLLWVAHQGRWNSQFFELSADGKSIAAVHHLAMILGVGPQGFGKFALNWLLSVSLGSLVVTIIGGIGEEAGWRGILQRPIAERFGSLKGTLMVGLIWGYWHLPVNLAGYNDAHHAVWQALLIFPIHTIAMSFLLAWLVARSGSIWPAALAHGANNTLQSGPLIMPNHWFADQLTAVAASLMIGTAAAALLLQRKAVRKIATGRLGKPDLVRQS